MRLNGRVGQVTGPFPVNINLLSDEGAIGKFTPEITHPVLTKLGIQAPEGTVVKINDVPIRIGQTEIYELDETVEIKSVEFPDPTEDNVLVDFIY